MEGSMADDDKPRQESTTAPVAKDDPQPAPKRMPKLPPGTVIVRGGGGVRTAIEILKMPSGPENVQERDRAEPGSENPPKPADKS
jgi:hypothetical protein